MGYQWNILGGSPQENADLFIVVDTGNTMGFDDIYIYI